MTPKTDNRWTIEAIRWDRLFLKPSWVIRHNDHEGKISKEAYDDKLCGYKVSTSDLKRGWTPNKILSAVYIIDNAHLWCACPSYTDFMFDFGMETERSEILREAMDDLSPDNWHKLLCETRRAWNWPAEYVPEIKSWLRYSQS